MFGFSRTLSETCQITQASRFHLKLTLKFDFSAHDHNKKKAAYLTECLASCATTCTEVRGPTAASHRRVTWDTLHHTLSLAVPWSCDRYITAAQGDGAQMYLMHARARTRPQKHTQIIARCGDPSHTLVGWRPTSEGITAATEGGEQRDGQEAAPPQ